MGGDNSPMDRLTKQINLFLFIKFPLFYNGLSTIQKGLFVVVSLIAVFTIVSFLFLGGDELDYYDNGGSSSSSNGYGSHSVSNSNDMSFSESGDQFASSDDGDESGSGNNNNNAFDDGAMGDATATADSNSGFDDSGMVDDESGEASNEGGDESSGDSSMESGGNDMADQLKGEERQGKIAEWKVTQAQLFKDKDKTFMKFFEKHRKESEIYSHFVALSDTYKHLDIIKSKIIGSTYEKRKIRAYEIGNGDRRRAILVVGMEHSAEWSVPMALTYFATRLVQKYTLNQAVTDVLDALKIYIIPVANPDGFAYSTSSSKHHTWQKNRYSSHHVKGVDINHDFDEFSQMESKAIRDFAASVQSELKAFVSVHCCAGSVIAPTNLTCINQHAVQEQRKVGQQIALAMGKGSNYQYPFMVQKPDPSAARGYSTTWAFERLGLKLSYTIEGRNYATKSSSTSTSVPTSHMVEHSQNVTMGIMELAKYIIHDYSDTTDGCDGKKRGGTVSASHTNSKTSSHHDVSGENGGDEDFQGGDEESDGGFSSGSDDESHGAHDREDAGEGEESKKHDFSANDDEDEEEWGNDDVKASRSHKFASTAEPDESSFRMSIEHALPRSRPPEIDSSRFLFFAYGAEMYYDVILKAGLASAWKYANARLDGYTFDFTYHSGKVWKSGIADIIKSPHSHVYGVVWSISKSQHDLLKSWMLATSETSPMVEKEVKVEDKHGNTFTATTYYIQKKSAGSDVVGKYRRFLPSRQYRNCVIKGAKQQHLPLEWIDKKLRYFSPLYTDKVGTFGHRHAAIGTVCDPE